MAQAAKRLAHTCFQGGLAQPISKAIPRPALTEYGYGTPYCFKDSFEHDA
jgi:hypothetical protein